MAKFNRMISTCVRFSSCSRGQPSILKGYSIDQIEEIPELNASAILLSHKNGSRHLHISREDSNNCFSVGFRTTPSDSTGVAHILEHTTLCGSKKFPVRDPFFKMLTRSLSSFMNAFTANDWTMYIFATQNNVDFQNLLRVYLDCVFFPNLRNLDFNQEGWRLEHLNSDNKYTPIVFKGVVYNEMKGHFSDPENLYSQSIQSNLFPKNASVSGGVPNKIINLSWEELKHFHRTLYHPSNSYFFTYGDIPIKNHLEVIDNEIFNNFTNSISLEQYLEDPRWDKPRKQVVHCPMNASSIDSSKQSTCSVSYRLVPITDCYETFVLQVLSTLLIDGPSSCFYKSLLENNIGHEYSSSAGYNGDTRDSYFSIGLQGINHEDAERVEHIIETTFYEIARKGFPEENVESVLNRIEIELKDQKANFGLHLSSNLMTPWIHGGDPMEFLKVDKLIKKLKNDLSLNKKFLQSKIQQYFLSNSHRLTLVMIPSLDYEILQKRDEADEILRKLSNMSSFEIDNIVDHGISLHKDQMSSVDTNCLPSIKLTDVRKEVVSYPQDYLNGDCPVHIFLQPTNGLTYLNVCFDITQLSEDMKIYVPLFSYIISRMGAGSLNYEELAQQIAKCSSEFSISPIITSDCKSTGRVHQELLCTSFCLDEKFIPMMCLWEDIFNKFNIENTRQLLILLKQLSNNIAMGLSHSGHVYAKYLSSSTLIPSAYYKEQLFGLTQLNFLKKLMKTDITEILHSLEVIGKFIFNSKNMRISVHTSINNVDTCKASLLPFIKSIPKLDDCTVSNSQHETFKIKQGLKHFVELPYSVNYIGQSYKTVPFCDSDTPRLNVLTRLLSSKYLHKHIREIGGAYGSGATNNDGIMSFMSYRDPNIKSTVEVIQGSLDWIKHGDYTDLDISESKISVFSELDSPRPPGKKGLDIFLKKISIAELQEYRNELFAVTREDLICVSERYLDTKRCNTTVLGDGSSLDKNKWRRFVL